jgi:hypothetical protein
MEAVYNKAGVPLVAYGKKSFITVTGAPKAAIAAIAAIKTNGEPIVVTSPTNDDPNVTQVDKIEIADWGSANRFPDEAIETIRKVGVLNTGLRFVRNFTLGQGLFPAKVIGYDKYGNEELAMVEGIPELVSILEGRVARRYMEKAARDYFKFGIGFVEIIMNADGSKVAGINTINARYSRLTKADAKTGQSLYCVVSGKWPDTPSATECEMIPVLDEYDPLDHLNRLRIDGKTAGKKFVYLVRDSWSNNDYYSEPIWYSAYLAGWTDIAAIVPAFLKKAFANQINWKWHVQIPYSYIDKRFPEGDFESILLRTQAIDAFMDDIEDNLCGQENSDKPIFTFYSLNEITGKAEEQWIITALDNKYKEGDKLITSAAANSEIMFALMINPNVMGAGMPGGTYAGNQGGSNIREAYLVNIANAWLDRQNMLDPIECMLAYNGITDVQIRYRNTILVTLDSGKGSTNVVS